MKFTLKHYYAKIFIHFYSRTSSTRSVEGRYFTPRLGQPIHIVRKQAENFFNPIFACTVARHYQDQQFCQVWDQFNKRNKIYRQKRGFDKSKVLGNG